MRVFTTEVFSAFAALYDSGRAMTLSLPLVTLSTVVAAAAAIAEKSPGHDEAHT